MKKDISFNIDFEYALSENINIILTAHVQLKHSTPHYVVTDFNFRKNPGNSPLLNDINIIALKNNNRIRWIHADSQKETLLSMSVGKAIEAMNLVELGNE